MHAMIDHILQGLDRHLENYNVPEEDVGIVVQPERVGSDDIRIYGHTRYTGDEAVEWQDYDMAVGCRGFPDRFVIDTIYTDLLDEIEDRYPEMQVSAPDPDIYL